MRTFDGDTYEPGRDGDRLTAQLKRVKTLMLDGRARTLAEIAERIAAPESSVSARLRDLRKPRNGCLIVERQYLRRGLFTYTVRPAQRDGWLF